MGKYVSEMLPDASTHESARELSWEDRFAVAANCIDAKENELQRQRDFNRRLAITLGKLAPEKLKEIAEVVGITDEESEAERQRDLQEIESNYWRAKINAPGYD